MPEKNHPGRKGGKLKRKEREKGRKKRGRERDSEAGGAESEKETANHPQTIFLREKSAVNTDGVI